MRLRELEYNVIFGVPGSYIMPLWQCFGDTPRIVLARHESGAAYMADGWARITKKPGVILTTIGPGLTNLITGVAGAYKDSVPLLAITGQGPLGSFGKGIFQECYPFDRGFSPCLLFSSITKGSFEINSVENAVYIFESALKLAVSGRPGPVHLSIPVNLQEKEIPEFEDSLKFNFNTSVGDYISEDINRVVDKLITASRPLIFAGWGCYLSGKMKELEELAQYISAPIVTSVKGLSAVNMTHSFTWGHVGPGQNGEIINLIKKYDPDVVLILGASLSEYYFGQLKNIFNNAYCVQIDVDPQQISLRFSIDMGVIADLRKWLPALLKALNLQKRVYKGVEFDKNALMGFHDWFDRNGIMARTIFELNQLIEDEVIVIPDAGNHWLNTLTCYQPKNYGGIMTNPGLGAMGYAVGASIGIKLASPDKKVICITGDGSALMNGNEISVAGELGLDNVFIIYNNSSMGRVRTYQNMVSNGLYIASDISGINFTLWAESMGLSGIRVNTLKEFKDAVRMALKANKPVVIEVMVSKDEHPVCFNLK